MRQLNSAVGTDVGRYTIAALTVAAARWRYVTPELLDVLSNAVAADADPDEKRAALRRSWPAGLYPRHGDYRQRY